MFIESFTIVCKGCKRQVLPDGFSTVEEVETKQAHWPATGISLHANQNGQLIWNIDLSDWHCDCDIDNLTDENEADFQNWEIEPAPLDE